MRHGFVENNLTFPDGTEWHYNRVSAYRVVFREQDDNKPVDRNDFRSYAELNKPMRGKTTYVPEYFGVSLFEDPEMFVNIKLFPKPGRKLAKGYVCDINGPKLDGNNTHICWWLYDDIDLSKSNFILVDENG